MREDGAAASLNFKDAVTIALLWNDLSIPGLLCMPLLCEPLVIQFEGKQGREAWKITLEMRHEIIG